MLPGGEADHGAWSQHLPAQLGVSTHSLGTLYKLSVFSVYIETPVVDDQAGGLQSILWKWRKLTSCQQNV